MFPAMYLQRSKQSVNVLFKGKPLDWLKQVYALTFQNYS